MYDDITDYPGETIKKSYLTTIKCLFNSTVSKENPKFMTAGVKKFYLVTPMDLAPGFAIRAASTRTPGCVITTTL